jgi:uncharacterized protein
MNIGDYVTIVKIIIFYIDNRVSKMFHEVKNENGEVAVTLASEHNFVTRNEIIVRIVDAPGPDEAKKLVDPGYTYYHMFPNFQFKMGSGIFYDESTKTYRANGYGFIVLDKSKSLRMVTPLQVSRDKTKAFYLIFPTKFGKIPGYGDIEEVIKLNKIITPEDQKKIESELAMINPHEKQITKIKIAHSKPPVNGRAEYFMPLINVEKKAGAVRDDGHIDFKEIESIIQVHKDQILLKHFPEVKPQDGFDIYGEKAAAVTEESKGFQRGDNIVQSKDPEIFVSAIDGCLDIDKKKISVKAVATIKGDIDYESGNIEFNGSVIVKGSVKPGFRIKATGDVTIEQSVDDGIIETSGSVFVKMGVAGKGQTAIKADKDIKVKFVINSTLEAKGRIEVEDSIINCKVFSNDRVLVTSKHAKIMGGEVVALYRIEANVAGSSNETATVLSVGRNLEIERELTEVRIKLNRKKEELEDVMTKVKTSFGMHLFDDPKKYISALPEIKRKQCLLVLAQISNINKEIKDLNLQGMQIEQKLVLDEEPYIVIKDKIFPGSTINIKKRTKKIEEEISNAKFYEDPEEKVIRFTSAM